MPELVLVANSIGSDLDLPPRTRERLVSCDLLIGEEVRTTSTLLKKLGIPRDFLVLNEHTKSEDLQELASQLPNQRLSCILSDSGNPGISDPAQRLVRLAWDWGVTVKTAPGPSAFVAALSSSGFASEPFSFLGFLPREPKERERALVQADSWGHTFVFYETPYRIPNVVESLAKVLGHRQVFLNLGIGLPDEKSYRAPAKELLGKTFPKSPPVFVVEGKKSGKHPKNS